MVKNHTLTIMVDGKMKKPKQHRIYRYPKCPICKHHHKVPDETKGEDELEYCWIRGTPS